MKKLRSDSSFNGLSAGQRANNPSTGSLMRICAAPQRWSGCRRSLGLRHRRRAWGGFIVMRRRSAHVGDLALAQGSVADFRTATRKLLGVATLNACMHNHDPRGGRFQRRCQP